MLWPPIPEASVLARALLDEGKTYCFDELDYPVMFGQTNELGALAMYLREGAMVYMPSVHDSFRRNTPKEAERLMREFVVNPAFRAFRIPRGEGIFFTYPANDSAASKLAASEYSGLPFQR